MDNQRPDRDDDPYDSVSLPAGAVREQIVSKDRLRTGHDRVTGLSGAVHGCFVCSAPVRVGTGVFELDNRALYQPMFRVGDKPTIPGSSIKGAVRSVVEAITASCILTKAKVPNSLMPCAITDLDHPSGAKLCPACRIFGAQGFLGRVALTDAPLVNGETARERLPWLWAPQDDQRERYYRVGKPKGRKFYRHGATEHGPVQSEVCGRGSAFRLRVDFRDLTNAELGLLLIGLGCAPDGQPAIRHKLGGSKPSCCGSVNFVLEQLRVENPMARWSRGAGAESHGQKDAGEVAAQDAAGGDAPKHASEEVQQEADTYMEAALDNESGLILAVQYGELLSILADPAGTGHSCGYQPRPGGHD